MMAPTRGGETAIVSDRFDEETLTMAHPVARRTVFAGAVAVAAVPAVSALARRGHKKHKKTRKAFRLVTGCRANGGCSCNACESHAANKLFASQAAVVRAHLGCNCRIDTVQIPRKKWFALFEVSQAVDRRDPRVQQILS
jgi:hypothetical protein